MYNAGMKAAPEIIEGPEAWNQFKGIMKGLMAVPRSEVLEREQARKEATAKNPNRRGPKAKTKT
jgi:hypothetical protein